LFFFFFSSRRRHTRFSRDWSSDVCSSDLCRPRLPIRPTGVCMSRFILFLRSLLFAVLLTVATVVWALMCFVFAPLPYRQRYYWKIGRASCRERVWFWVGGG